MAHRHRKSHASYTTRPAPEREPLLTSIRHFYTAAPDGMAQCRGRLALQRRQRDFDTTVLGAA